MGAQGQASGQPRAVPGRIAASRITTGDRTSEGRTPRDHPMSFLLGTNVLSEWVRPRPEPNVVAWLAAVDEDQVFLSVVSFAELRRGVELLPAGRPRERL